MAPPFHQVFPPAPKFTENELGSLEGKVVIVTGATSGVGYELANIIFKAGAAVYVAARSPEKIKSAIDIAEAKSPGSKGRLVALPLDLSDQASIRKSADEFMSKESRLDILVNNAGVMTPPAGSKDRLGHDLEMGTNCLGPFLFYTFLSDTLKTTAASSSPKANTAIRVVWVSSIIEASVTQECISFDAKTGQPVVLRDAMENYMQSKVGNVFIASELAKRSTESGAMHLSVHPGLMRTELQRHRPAIQRIMMGLIFKGPKYGAYSELYAACSPEITLTENGGFVIPWGRIGTIPDNVQRAMRSTSEGGTGVAQRFVEWCEQETRQLLAQ